MTTRGTVRHRLRVPYAHVDQMKFVYYANYLVYFEIARSDMLRRSGLPYPELERRGIMLPIVEAHCSYHRPARYDDLIEIAARCAAVKGTRLRIEYEILCIEPGLEPPPTAQEPSLLATGYTEHVCMSPQGKVLRPAPEIASLVRDATAEGKTPRGESATARRD